MAAGFAAAGVADVAAVAVGCALDAFALAEGATGIPEVLADVAEDALAFAAGVPAEASANTGFPAVLWASLSVSPF